MLSIIIVNYRSWKRLSACLHSIEQQGLQDLEVIVVDNFSNDGQGESFAAQFPNVKWIMQNINGGFAQACNKGAAHANGNWLLFLNPDTILNTPILNPLLEKAEQHSDWKLIGIRQLNDAGKDTHPHGVFLKWWNVWPPFRSLERLIKGREYSKHYLSTAPITFPDWISGAFVLIRKNDFQELGGWDERFWMYYEDMDLSKRAADKGWKRVMYNELVCVHSHGGSSRINHEIKALTKSTVIKSASIYINKYMTGFARLVAQATLYKITIIDLLLSAPFSTTKRKMIRLFLKG
ncbi:MAG: glycosyltransferase family 2 protein [Chitinophagaceae bacterium]|jgi:GT2 family glycosyltransferase